MRKIKWFATAAVGAFMIGGLVGWSSPNIPAVVAAPTLSQTDPFQIITNAKDLPTHAFEDRTFVFAERRPVRWQESASQAAKT
jgi:hypothetical protein